MRVYLDNCCYNRPYDDQSQLRISLEAQAKIQIQTMIRNHSVELSSSYVLLYENSKNPYDLRKNSIQSFVKDNVSVYIDVDRADEEKVIADRIISTGVKTVDAHHVACAILAESDYFLTTDDRLLKYRTNELHIIDPVGFIRELEAEGYDDNE